jgi:hypothetical protein
MYLPIFSRLSYFQKGKECLDLGFEVAGGHIIKCAAKSMDEMLMIADDGFPLRDSAYGVILFQD